MAKIFTFFCLLTISLATSAQYSANEVDADLTFLQNQLKTFHPGYDRYTSRNELDETFERAISEGSMSDLELYTKVKALLSKIGCGHTRAQMSNEMGEDIELNQVFIPFTVKFLADQVFIDKTLNEQLQQGQEVVAINGFSMDQIKEKVFALLPGDGYIQTGKLRRLELLFDGYFQLYVDPAATSYNLSVRDTDGNESEVFVEGVSSAEINSIRNQVSGELLALEYSENYAYMRIRTFGSYSLSRSGYDYERFLEKSFKELKEKKTSNLILDLRGNGGGSDNYGALLVSYLAKDSFGYFDNIQVTENYPGIATKIGDTYFMTDHKGLSVWQPQRNAFEGKVYVLIDGFSFSTCADVATVLHHHNWATFIGEETGGGYDGNTSGRSKTIILPHSKISVNVPMWMYITANVGHDYAGRGVIPDYPISQSWEEYASGNDTALDKARSLIESK